MGEFVSGSYEGPHILAKSIKQEFISPSDLEAYNRSAIGDKDKLVLVQEKLAVCMMSRRSTAKNS